MRLVLSALALSLALTACAFEDEVPGDEENGDRMDIVDTECVDACIADNPERIDALVFCRSQCRVQVPAEIGPIGSGCDPSVHPTTGDVFCHPAFLIWTQHCDGSCPGEDTFCVAEPPMYPSYEDFTVDAEKYSCQRGCSSRASEFGNVPFNPLGGMCVAIARAGMACPRETRISDTCFLERYFVVSAPDDTYTQEEWREFSVGMYGPYRTCRYDSSAPSDSDCDLANVCRPLRQYNRSESCELP